MKSANPSEKKARHVVFITGASGYIGAMLADQFSHRPDVTKVIGLDKEPAPEFLVNTPKYRHIVGNTSDDSWRREAAADDPDVVIHCAWQIRELYGKKRLQWRWNVEGSENVFDFAMKTPSVKRLVHFSTVASYGAYSSNSIEHRFTEEEPFRKSDYLYAEEKRLAEERLKSKFEIARRDGKDIQVAVIRPAAVTGPRGRYMRVRFGLQATLSGQLKDSESAFHRLVSSMVSFVPVTPKWCRQFIHEDDLTDLVAILAFDPLKHDYDSFNACPPGDVVKGADMAEAVGKRTMSVPPSFIRPVFFVMWHLSRGKVPTSRGGWRSYSYPIAVDGSKVTRMYGFEYKWQPKEAFVKKEGRYMKYVETVPDTDNR